MTPGVRAVRTAYDETAGAWAAGPERVYAALAEALVARSPVDLAGWVVLDIGAGTGVASRVLQRLGARPVGVDVSLEMLRHDATRRPPALVADAMTLPLADGSVGGAVYAFCLNHLEAPEVALQEAARVVRRGGVILASVFSADYDPPEKRAVEKVLGRFGWIQPEWHDSLKELTEPLLATPERFAACARAAGLVNVAAIDTTVETDLHRPEDVVAWRLGMPHTAPFVAGLPAQRRAALSTAAAHALAGLAQRVRPRVVLLSSRVAA